jgi:hypothetical protein
MPFGFPPESAFTFTGIPKTEPGKFRGYGGKVTVVRNWVPLDRDLTPTQFRYAVV